MSYSNSGTLTVTADSVIGISGSPVRIYSIYWVKGTGAETMVVRSGSTSSGSIVIEQVSTADDGNLLVFGAEGMLFPLGAFFDISTAIDSATFTFRAEL